MGGNVTICMAICPAIMIQVAHVYSLSHREAGVNQHELLSSHA